jgi:hypothetical protein
MDFLRYASSQARTKQRLEQLQNPNKKKKNPSMEGEIGKVKFPNHYTLPNGPTLSDMDC